MRVLVTGASGFVGSHTLKALLGMGHRPRLLVRDPGRAAGVLGEIGVSAGAVEMLPGDMLDEAAVARALDGCDTAVHAAAALGLTLRPVGETVADALRRLAAAGHLAPAKAGRLVPTRST
jgi:uncharacterized protein YbjT (DUF2867 family)